MITVLCVEVYVVTVKFAIDVSVLELLLHC